MHPDDGGQCSGRLVEPSGVEDVETRILVARIELFME